MERIRILNTQVDNLSMDEAVEEIRRLAALRGCAYVVTPNLDHLINLEKDPAFAEAYENAALVLADGVSVMHLAKRAGTPLKEKVSGSDLFPRVCSMAAREGFSLFILGAAPGVAKTAAENLAAKNPGLKIAGTYSPPMGFENDEAEIEKIIGIVNSASPDIMAVAIGDTKGEKFLCRYRERLGVPVSLSIGASVDFEAGTRKRAPRWVSELGFEWLYRCLQEPRRIGGRVIRDLKGLGPLMRKYR